MVNYCSYYYPHPTPHPVDEAHSYDPDDGTWRVVPQRAEGGSRPSLRRRRPR